MIRHALERLELRTLLAATLQPGGVLTVVGTENPDTIQIDDLGVQTLVMINGTPTFFNASDINAINADLLGGADVLVININRPTTVLGGAGSDVILGSDGGNDNVIGGAGADTFSGRNGNDTFTWNPGDGNDQINGNEGDDTHIFNGSAADEIITVTPNGTRVRLDRNIGNIIMDIGTFEHVIVNALGGNDTVSGAAGLAALTRLTFNGGDGNDVLNGGDGADSLNGGEGNDVVDGNQGADTAFLGAGDDTFIWDPGDGSDFVEGEAGFDTLLFNGSNANEFFNASVDGSRLRFFRSVGNIVMDVGTTEKLDLRALGGNDTITIEDVSGVGVTDVVVDGGAGEDFFSGSAMSETFLGGADNDTAIFGAGDFYDMGAGVDTLRFIGTTGKDNIHIDRRQVGGNQQIIFRAKGEASAIFNNGETIDVHTLTGKNDKVKVHKRAEELWDVVVTN